MATVADWLKNLTKSGGLTVNNSGLTGSIPKVAPKTSVVSTTQAGLTPDYSGNQIFLGTPPGQTLGDSTTYDSGGYSSGGSYDPQAAQKSGLIGTLQSTWNNLQNVYNGLFGQVDNYAKDATSRLQQSYDTQQNQDINNFNKAQGLTTSTYAARGIGDSSYLGDAMGQNSNDFNNALAQQALNRDAQLSQIGRQATTQKAQLQAQLQAQRDAYAPYLQNLSQYGVADLKSLQNNLASAIGSANVTGAGLGTSSDYINKLNAITPLESQASAQLATKLKNLTLSSAPAQAKKYIAMGLIKANTLNDANANSYWQSYFDQLLNGQA